MLFKLLPALLDGGDQFGAVLVVRVHLLKQFQVVLAKAHGVLPCQVRRLAQQLQHGAGAAQARFEQLAFHPQHATVAQRIPVRHVTRAGHNFQVREMLARQVDDLERLRHVVHRHCQHFGMGGAGGAQQIEPGRVAIENLGAKDPRGLYHLGVVVQHRGLYALGPQHATNDLTVAAKAGNDDGGVLRLGNFGHQRDLAARKTRQQQFVYGHQHQRAQQHGNRYRANQQ